jgi:hypothetical protein
MKTRQWPRNESEQIEAGFVDELVRLIGVIIMRLIIVVLTEVGG